MKKALFYFCTGTAVCDSHANISFYSHKHPNALSVFYRIKRGPIWISIW
jgi:hypothetical protein